MLAFIYLELLELDVCTRQLQHMYLHILAVTLVCRATVCVRKK